MDFIAPFILIVLSASFTAAADQDKNNGTNIVCSLSEYVRVGLEFESCQQEAVDAFTAGPDPCAAIKNMAVTCASSAKVMTNISNKIGHRMYCIRIANRFLCNLYGGKNPRDLVRKLPRNPELPVSNVSVKISWNSH